MSDNPYNPPNSPLERPLVTTVPLSVRISVALLWFAWAQSVTLAIYNHYLLQARGSALGLSLSFLGLVIQAVAIYFIGRGSNPARITAVVFFLLGTPGFYLAMRLIGKLSVLSVTLSTFGYALRVLAIFLLFSTEARLWFKASPANGA